MLKNKEVPPYPTVLAKPYDTDLATLVAAKEQFGVMLTAFLLIKKGDKNPYLDCQIEIIGGPDNGKRFVADFGKPQRFLEPLSVSLKAEVV